MTAIVSVGRAHLVGKGGGVCHNNKDQTTTPYMTPQGRPILSHRLKIQSFVVMFLKLLQYHRSKTAFQENRFFLLLADADDVEGFCVEYRLL